MQNIKGNESYTTGMTLKLSGVWTLVWVLTFFWQMSTGFSHVYDYLSHSPHHFCGQNNTSGAHAPINPDSQISYEDEPKLVSDSKSQGSAVRVGGGRQGCRNILCQPPLLLPVAVYLSWTADEL